MDIPWYDYRESIGCRVFSTTGLTTSNIPNSVTRINQEAFGNLNNNLTNVTVHREIPLSFSEPNPFAPYTNVAKITLHVPKGVEYMYANAPILKNFNLPECPCTDYDNIRENEHFIFEATCQYLRNHVSPTNLQKWLSHLMHYMNLL